MHRDFYFCYSFNKYNTMSFGLCFMLKLMNRDRLKYGHQMKSKPQSARTMNRCFYRKMQSMVVFYVYNID